MPNNEFHLRCACGTVEMTAEGGPAAAVYCHCHTCREFYGVPVFAATAWKKDAVRVSKGAARLGLYRHPTKQMQRHFCMDCGETMLGENRLGMTIVRNALFANAAGGSLPTALQPTLHLFYAYRVLDIDDELPKYLEGWDGPLFT